MLGALASAPAFAQSPPTGVNDTANAFEDEVIVIEVLNNDTDPEDGIVTRLNLGSPPVHGTVSKALGCGSGECDAIQYTPEAFYGGDFTFTYFPVDSDGLVGNETTVTVTVTRTSPNQAPTAMTNDYNMLSAIDSGGTTTLDVVANDFDVDGDPLTLVAVTQPPGGAGVVTLRGDGLVDFRPATFYRGTATFTYTIWDGVTDPNGIDPNYHHVSATVFVDVQNRPPNPQSPTATTTMNTPVGFAAISQQPDPEFDNVITGGLTQPANGTAVYEGTTGFTYTPNPGFVGVDTFTFYIEDIYQATAPSVATITVTEGPENAPPVASDDVATTRAGPTAGEQIFIDVLANDTDPDGDLLEVVSASEAANGSLIVTPGGALRYTPNAGFTGTEVVTYDLSDRVNPVVTATVTITVEADNPPVAANDTAQTQAWVQGQGPPSVVQIPVLANDADPDSGDTLAYRDVVIVQQPQNGTVTFSCVGACNPPDYQPNSGFSGTDTFTYRAVDQLGAQSNVATVTIDVLTSGANLPPVANSDNAETVVGVPVTIDVLANDTDPENQALTIVDVQSNSLGTAEIVQNRIVFTPNGTTGTNAFGYTIVDSFQPAASASAFVIITVNPAPGVPTAIIAGGNRTIADSNGVPGESVAFDGTQSFDSGSGTITAYEWGVIYPNNGGVAAYTGATPTISLGDGDNIVSLVVTNDSGVRSAENVVTVRVTAPGNQPVVTIGVGSTSIPDSDGEPGENVPFQGSATDADGTVAQSTFRWTVNGQAVPTADGQANPTLALLNGSNVVGLTVTDNSGLTGSTSVNVTIGEASAIEELPGIEGNENLENTAKATDTTCSTLLKADPSTLTAEQVNLRSTCETIYANVDQNPEEVVAALETISAQQVTAQQSAAIDYTSAQLLNVAGRLTALRQGAKGVSFAGLNVGTPGSSLPVGALVSLGKFLFGEGGSSGDDEGGLLDDKLGIFVNGSVRFGDKETTANETGFDFDTQGLTVGADYRFTDALVLGFALGYGNASADFVANGGTQDSDSYAGTVYGSWYGSRSYFDGIVSLGSVSYDSVRNINLFDGAIVDKALGTTDGTQWAVGMAAGFDFGKGGLRFGPNFAVNYIKADIDGFTERTEGTSGLAMSFADQSADSLTIKAGGHFNYSLSRKWGIVSPQARFDIVRELANDSQAITIRYANDPLVTSPGQAGGSFTIFTDDPDEYYFLWALGVAVQFANGLSGFIDYESTESLDTINSAEVSFGLRYQTRFR